MWNVLKFWTLYSILFWSNFFLMLLYLKIFNGMANIVDPDQTVPSEAVWYGSALFAYVIFLETLMYEILGHLPYFLLTNSFRLVMEIIFVAPALVSRYHIVVCFFLSVHLLICSDTSPFNNTCSNHSVSVPYQIIALDMRGIEFNFFLISPQKTLIVGTH